MDRLILRKLPVKDRDMFLRAGVAMGKIGDAIVTASDFIGGIESGDAAKIDAIEALDAAKDAIETINVSMGDYLKIYAAWIDQERELGIAIKLLEDIPHAIEEYRMRAYLKLYPRIRPNP